MTSISKKHFYRKSGQPRRALQNCLDYFKCKTLEELQAKVAAKEVRMGEVIRLRGCSGSVGAPSKLVQFLFNVPSREERIRQSVLDNLGDGI